MSTARIYRTRTFRRAFLLIGAAALIVIAAAASLQPQQLQWQEGQAHGSFAVDRSAVLLPGTCVGIAWNVIGVDGVRLNNTDVANAVSGSLCVEPNQSPTWALRVVGGFDRFQHLQVGVLIYRLDFWLLVLAVVLCAAGAVVDDPRFRPAALPVVKLAAALAGRLRVPGARLRSWLVLVGSLTQVFFLLRFLSFTRAYGISAWLLSAAMLLVLACLNLRPIQRLSARALTNLLFPFALVTTSELFRIVLRQWGAPDSDALLAEVYLYRGFVFVFLFIAWGALTLRTRLHGVSFARDGRLSLPRLERIRAFGLAMLCLALLGFWAYVHLVNAAPTYGQNFSWDSEPSFFIDGLTLFHGANYAYIQHPDATVSMLSSAVLALTYPFVSTRSDSFVMYQLQHPALFVAAARLLTTLLCCLCFIALSYLVVPRLRSGRDLLVALGLPASLYALNPLSFETITLRSHHTLGFALSVLVLLCLLRVVESAPKLRHFQATALAAGLMMAGSFFYGPLAVGVVVTTAVYFAWTRHFSLARTLYAALVAGIAVLTGFIGGVAVIAYGFQGMVSYAFALLSHAGSYGQGQAAFLDVDKVRRDFANLLNSTPWMFALLVLAAVGLLVWAAWHRSALRERRGLWAFGLGLAVQIALGLLLVVKMYNLYYALCVTAAVIAVLALFMVLTDSSRWLRAVAVPFAALMLVGYVVTYRSSLIDYNQSAADARTAQVASTLLLADYAAAQHKDVTQVQAVVGYASFNDCYYLRFGDASYQSAFEAQLDQLCPTQTIYPPGPFTAPVPWEVYLRRNPPQFLFRDLQDLPTTPFAQQGNMELVTNPNRPPP